MTLDKLPLAEERTIELHPNGPLNGHTVVMRYPSTALYLKVRGDDNVTNDDMLSSVLAAVVDDTLPAGVIGLPPDQVVGLFPEWLNAWMEAAFPNRTGRRTRKPSPSSP